MNETRFTKGGPSTRVVRYFVLAMFVVTLAACIAAVPYAVKMVREAGAVKLTVVIDGNAEEIYAASVDAQKRKDPNTEIIKDDREDLEFEGKRVENGVEFWGKWEAKQLDGGKTEVEYMLKGKGVEEDALERRAIEGIQAFCAEIGKRCQIEK